MLLAAFILYFVYAAYYMKLDPIAGVRLATIGAAYCISI